jgi:hypothetical protein
LYWNVKSVKAEFWPTTQVTRVQLPIMSWNFTSCFRAFGRHHKSWPRLQWRSIFQWILLSLFVYHCHWNQWSSWIVLIRLGIRYFNFCPGLFSIWIGDDRYMTIYYFLNFITHRTFLLNSCKNIQASITFIFQYLFEFISTWIHI